MFLRFERHGRKWYARTPSGEYAFADCQGLYEWRNGQRVDYTGGDAQASDCRGMWSKSGRPEPRLLGTTYAISRYSLPAN